LHVFFWGKKKNSPPLFFFFLPSFFFCKKNPPPPPPQKKGYDMYNHRNGNWTNTQTIAVHGIHHITRAIKDIKKGEQIYISYNQCEDCNNRQYEYGTAGMYHTSSKEGKSGKDGRNLVRQHPPTITGKHCTPSPIRSMSWILFVLSLIPTFFSFFIPRQLLRYRNVSRLWFH